MSDQPQQPLFSTFAHVFQIDPSTKKSWIPISKQEVNVSYYYDSSKFMYRIVSVEDAKALINSTITSGMTFTKTSQKFGQWSDAKVNTVYGLGFASESDLTKFAEKFKEVKNNVKLGTPPATPKSVLLNMSNGTLPSGSLKSMSSNSTGSIEEEHQSPGSHRSSSSSSESQMKYENDRLKKALAQSSANAKKWEAEFQTLKNNNARLTAALQESAANVEKWKEQLNNYKEENSRLRKKLKSADSAGSSGDLEKRLHDTEMKLKRKEEDMNKLSQHSSEELHRLREKNGELTKRIQRLESENRRKTEDDHAAEEKVKQLQDSKLRQLNDIRNEMGSKLSELNDLQQKMTSVLKYS